MIVILSLDQESMMQQASIWRSNMGFQDRRYDRGPREMHKAVCADCKKPCEVPFKPREDRPVYCKDCFPKHKDSSGR